MLKHRCKEECKQFFQHVEGLYASCLAGLHPDFLLGADPDAIYNLCLILKIML
jgi:hypothetical protein